MYKYNNISDEDGPCKLNLVEDIKEGILNGNKKHLKESVKVVLNIVF